MEEYRMKVELTNKFKALNKISILLQRFAPVSMFELVTAPEIATYWEDLNQDREGFLGEELFPNNRQEDTDISWFKGQTGAPIAIRPSALDVPAIPRDRKEFDKMVTELGFFKESHYIDETTRRNLVKMIQTGNQEFINNVLNKIFDDVGELIDAAAIRREITRMELLSTGEIDINGNGQEYYYDYGFPDNHRFAPNVGWDAEESDPVADLEDAMIQIETDTGEKPVNLLFNVSVMNQLRNNKTIQRNLFPNGAGNIRVGVQDIISYLQNNLGLRNVIVYSKRYTTEDGSTKPYVADNTVILLPDGPVGTTWMGSTPEEFDLATGGTDAQVQIVDGGVAITTSKIVDPVRVDTKVSMMMMPSYELINQVGIFTTTP